MRAAHVLRNHRPLGYTTPGDTIQPPQCASSDQANNRRMQTLILITEGMELAALAKRAGLYLLCAWSVFKRRWLLFEVVSCEQDWYHGTVVTLRRQNFVCMWHNGNRPTGLDSVAK
jgi:hypothetical protein